MSSGMPRSLPRVRRDRERRRRWRSSGGGLGLEGGGRQFTSAAPPPAGAEAGQVQRKGDQAQYYQAGRGEHRVGRRGGHPDDERDSKNDHRNNGEHRSPPAQVLARVSGWAVAADI